MGKLLISLAWTLGLVLGARSAPAETLTLSLYPGWGRVSATSTEFPSDFRARLLRVGKLLGRHSEVWAKAELRPRLPYGLSKKKPGTPALTRAAAVEEILIEGGAPSTRLRVMPIRMTEGLPEEQLDLKLTGVTDPVLLRDALERARKQ